MQEFKKIVKMKCGGSVSKAVEKCGGGRMKEGGSVMHDDVKEDKKLIKKAFNLHDDQKHEGKTDLSGLKKGGRAKKDTGTVRKYKCGGNVKKMADGSLTGPLTAANQAAGIGGASPVQNAAAAQLLKRKLMAQRGIAPAAMGAAGAAPAGGLGATPPALDQAPTPQNIGATTGPIMKKGGKVKKGGK